MTKNYFPQLDLEQFWDDDELALEEYVDEAPDDLLIASIENELAISCPILICAYEAAQRQAFLTPPVIHCRKKTSRMTQIM